MHSYSGLLCIVQLMHMELAAFEELTKEITTECFFMTASQQRKSNTAYRSSSFYRMF
jgi:hypothetical protein